MVGEPRGDSLLQKLLKFYGLTGPGNNKVLTPGAVNDLTDEAPTFCSYFIHKEMEGACKSQ